VTQQTLIIVACPVTEFPIYTGLAASLFIVSSVHIMDNIDEDDNHISLLEYYSMDSDVYTGLPLLFKRWRVSRFWPHWNRANMHEIMLKNSVPDSSDMDHRL